MSTILICTDGSDLADQAAADGIALLRSSDDAVVVTVVEPLDLALGAQMSGFAGAGMSAEEIDRLRANLLSEATAAVERTAASLGLAGARTVVLEGDPGVSICNYAEELDAAAIVMGSRGRGGFKRALLGSVSDHVVRHAPCPVVIVNAVSQD